MKVLIIEDEERGFSRLKRLVQNIDNSLEIQGPLTTTNRGQQRQVHTIEELARQMITRISLIVLCTSIYRGHRFYG